MINGSTQIGGVRFLVNDEDLALVRDGEGTSEIVSQNLIERLEFVVGLLKLNLAQHQRFGSSDGSVVYAFDRDLNPVL